MKKLLSVFVICALLAACADSKRPVPPGERLAVKNTAAAEVQKATTNIQVGQTVSDFNWSQNNGNAKNLMPHGQLSDSPQLVWKRSIGKGISDDNLLLPEPVFHDGVIYALDSTFRLSAVRAKDGKLMWQIALPVSEDLGLASIGLAADSNAVYAVGGNGMIYAVDFEGKILWQKNTNSILRSAPTIEKGILYVLSGNNELFALDSLNGEEIWRYQNLSTMTNLLGMGQPAVSNGVLVVPFSSGEIIAFDAKTGVILWSDALLSARTFNQIQDISHVLAAPVIDGNTVYLVGNAQKTGAYDLRTGTSKYVQNIGGTSTPVVSGNALFLITNRNTLTALEKSTGRLVWEIPLESKEMKNIVWNGPVLAGNQLIVVSNKGDVVFVAPQNGQIKQTIRRDGFSNKPILGDEKVILLSNEAELVAYQ